MKGSKWENIFIENNITGNIDSASGDIKALDTLMKRTIANKDRPSRMKGKFNVYCMGKD
jgi:hypothetical protein